MLSLTNDGLVTYARRAGTGRGDDRSRSGGRAAHRARRRPHVYVPAAERGAVLDRRTRAPGLISARHSSASTAPRQGLSAFGVAIRGADAARDRAATSRAELPVDEAARTITFRLSEPDPDFLYKLALPFGSVVPAGSPRSAPVRTRCRPRARTGSCATCPAVRPCSCGIVTSGRGRRPRSRPDSPTASHCA